MSIGSYGKPGLAVARKTVKELRARVALGFDPATEKQERKANNRTKAEALRNMRTVGQLMDEFFARYVDGKLTRPRMIRQRLDIHIKRSAIGGLAGWRN